jgi:phosphoglucosamine mutase
MAERGIRVVTTDVGDRYVLEALEQHGGLLGGEQSGHVIYLKDHVTGDGLAAGLLLCAALHGRKLSDAAALLVPYFQCKENVRVTSKEIPRPVRQAVERANAELGEEGRILVRPSGTEPIIRVLVEARNGDLAKEACGTIARLVESELG